MNRYGQLYHKIYSIDNLYLADNKARKNKKNQYSIQIHDKCRDQNILTLQQSLINKTYKTSKYSVFTLYDPKEREIYRLPYFPDRIVHHAIMNVLEPLFVSCFVCNTYNCIKKRGIHGAHKTLKIALSDACNTKYCLKLDINKFYPSINNAILKQLLRKKFKDGNLLWLLDEIIDSTKGIPIGNYLSQYFANFYLTYFDHWLKEDRKVKYYFRYCDDIVILGKTKEELHILLSEIRIYLWTNLQLKIKNNYQVFPINKRGIDFVGYKFYHTHILLRKSIKKRFINMTKYNDNIKSRASYNGWLKYCNSINLQTRYLNDKTRDYKKNR